MPTVYKAELTETETPWLRIWQQMEMGLQSNARQILGMLNYYCERDLDVPATTSSLTKDENEELAPILAALTIAAIESDRMPDGPLVATLGEIAKQPSLLDLSNMPGAVAWEVARNYARGAETPGTYATDVLGVGNGVKVNLVADSVARAAQRAAARVQGARLRGRPPNRAHAILADRLGRIFRASGQSIRRQQVNTGKVRWKNGKQVDVFIETGTFHEFLELVTTPLRAFLRDRELSISIERIARMASQGTPRKPT